MAVLNGLRPFQRLYNGIQIQLRLEDWPADVPLPAGSAVVGIGENHQELVHPYWRFVLEPAATIEVVVGWFRVPLVLEEAIDWYRAKLTKRGWVEETAHGFVESEWAALDFAHPEKKAKVRLSIRRWESLNETTVIIERGIKYPWMPAEEQASEPHSLAEVEEALALEEVHEVREALRDQGVKPKQFGGEEKGGIQSASSAARRGPRAMPGGSWPCKTPSPRPPRPSAPCAPTSSSRRGATGPSRACWSPAPAPPRARP